MVRSCYKYLQKGVSDESLEKHTKNFYVSKSKLELKLIGGKHTHTTLSHFVYFYCTLYNVYRQEAHQGDPAGQDPHTAREETGGELPCLVQVGSQYRRFFLCL